MMNRILSILLLMLFAVCANAASIITATVTVTNQPVDGETFVVNTSSRTFKTSVSTPSTEVLIGASIGASATNLWQHCATYSMGYGIGQTWGTSSNIFKIVAPVGGSLSVSSSGTYFSVSYSTQTLSSVTSVRVPLASVTVAERTNHATLLVDGISDYSQTAIDQTSTAASELVGVSNTQTISGQKTFSGATYFADPQLTNGVNYGDAFRSPGSGTRSEQYGDTASATGMNSTAVGYGATATDSFATGVGSGAGATAYGSSSFGMDAQASARAATAIGFASTANHTNTVALGAGSTASYENSTAIGRSAQTTATNQVMLGISTGTVVSSGVFSSTGGITNTTYYGTMGSLSGGLWSGGGATNLTATNMVAYGTNTLNGIYKLPKTINTSLANGNNANIDFGTATLIKINAGPTSAFAICGISGGADGRLLILDNRTGQNMTISNDSGVDGTAANRIYTATGSDHATTGNGVAMLVYDSTDSRWHLINLEQ